MFPHPLSALLVLPLIACACGEEPGSAGNGSSHAAEPQAVPLRVLPANASAAELVLALIPPERIVALPREVRVYAHAAVGVEEWPEDRTFTRFLGEEVLAHEPDLVVAHAWQSRETRDILDRAGVRVCLLAKVEAFEDVLASLEQLGAVLGATERAEAVVAGLERRRQALSEAAATRPALRVLPYTNFGTGGWSAGSGTTLQILIELAGHENAGAEGGRTGHFPADIERLLTIDPDLILVPEANEEYSASAAWLRDEEALQHLRALRQGLVIQIPATLYQSNSHTLLDAAELFALEVRGLAEAGADAEEQR